MAKANRKNEEETLYGIYKDLNTGQLFCEDFNKTDSITCEFLGFDSEVQTCPNGSVGPFCLSPIVSSCPEYCECGAEGNVLYCNEPVTGCFPRICPNGMISDCSGSCEEVICPDGSIIYSSPSNCPRYTCWDGSENWTGLDDCPPQE